MTDIRSWTIIECGAGTAIERAEPGDANPIEVLEAAPVIKVVRDLDAAIGILLGGKAPADERVDAARNKARALLFAPAKRG